MRPLTALFYYPLAVALISSMLWVVGAFLKSLFGNRSLKSTNKESVEKQP
jgi:Ca-activated chloride channel family protein